MMFLEELADLKDRYPDRFQLVHVLSREEQEVGAALRPARRGARLTPAARRRSSRSTTSTTGSCAGRSAGRAASATRCCAAGVPAAASTRSSSTSSEAPRRGRAAAAEPRRAPGASSVTVTLDGRPRRFAVPRRRPVLLDAVLRIRADAPYACKGGVCGTCRARLVAGEVAMDRNYALEPDEMDAGLRAGLPVPSGHRRGRRWTSTSDGGAAYDRCHGHCP